MEKLKVRPTSSAENVRIQLKIPPDLEVPRSQAIAQIDR